MLNYTNLMSITEAAKGFTGGSCVDEFPEMSLSECINTFPIAIAEEQLAGINAIRVQNESVVNAMVQALQEGATMDTTALQEASIESLKKRIKAVFDRIIKFISSIIAKIKTQADALFMSGKKMYESYKNSPSLKDTSKFSELTFNGYKFNTNETLFANISKYDSGNISDLISKGVGSNVVPPQNTPHGPYSSDEPLQKAADDRINKIKDTSSSDRVSNMAKELTGVADLGDNWESDLKEKLYGDKTDLKYGTDFTVDSLAKILQDPKTKSSIQDGYQKLLKSCGTYRDQINRAADSIKENTYDRISNDPDASKTDLKYNKNSKGNFEEYLNLYLNLISEAINVVSRLKNIRWDFYKEQYGQARKIFAKLITFKESKSEKEDASDDELIGDMEFEL